MDGGVKQMWDILAVKFSVLRVAQEQNRNTKCCNFGPSAGEKAGYPQLRWGQSCSSCPCPLITDLCDGRDNAAPEFTLGWIMGPHPWDGTRRTPGSGRKKNQMYGWKMRDNEQSLAGRMGTQIAATLLPELRRIYVFIFIIFFDIVNYYMYYNSNNI